jgi:GT2 family glycosyltransferase
MSPESQADAPPLEKAVERVASTPVETRPGRGSLPGLVSILIPCFGQLEYTRLCVPSVLRHSQPPYELLFLDGDSLDGTVEYLAGVAAAAAVRVEVRRFPGDPISAPPGPEGMVQPRGDFIVLLSNDTIVTDRWLEHLVKLATCDPALGMVGPMTNHGPAPQLAGPVSYQLGRTQDLQAADLLQPEEILRQLEAVNRFARAWRDSHRGEWQEVDRLGGGCVLLKRPVMQAIGLSLAQSRLGFFDLDDLSQRITRAGYRLACCGDLFIHHFGSRG